MSQEWPDPVTAFDVATSIARLKARTETLRTSQQGADFPTSPHKGYIYCDDDGIFWGYNGTLWKKLSTADDEDGIYLPTTCNLFGPVQPANGAGGSPNDTPFVFQPDSTYKFLGQMASASTTTIGWRYYNMAPLVQAWGQVIWDPENTNVSVRFGWFSQSVDDPAYDLTPYHMTTLGDEIHGETSSTAPGGGPGTGGSDGPVPRGTFFGEQLNERIQSGYTTDIGWQGKASDGPSGSKFTLTNVAIKFLWGPF